MNLLERLQNDAADRHDQIMRDARMMAPHADFWPLVTRIRIGYSVAVYALIWSVAALPMALSLGPILAHLAPLFHLPRDYRPDPQMVNAALNARHLWQMQYHWVQIFLIWLLVFGMGFLVALPHVLWQAALERRRPTGRLGYVLRSLKIGVGYGVIQSAAVAPVLWSMANNHWHGAMLSLAFLLTSVICAYVVGRIEAKSVPLEEW